ncbi:MAG TPA: cytochrome c peroxidase [Flavihumibacter sp.]|nr:cytochrome c peroxidase [Flavihumibacter sp.]
MRNLLTWISFGLCSVAVFALACNKQKDVVTEPIVFKAPDGWPATVYDFNANPITNAGFALGKKLFYDGKLSKDGNFPCGSCHQQFAAFSNYDHDFSHGFNNQFTTRNAPALNNLAWQSAFHRDGGISNLDLQPLAPITAPNEMAETIPHVLAKLAADPDYPALFKAAFADGAINTANMTKALSQFMLMLVSADAKYDQVKAGTASFDVNEAAGYALFQSKGCTNCHAEPLFTNNAYVNDNLPVDPVRNDVGRMAITGDAADYGKFKVPSLRNVALSFPYMHDGRFGSLSEVMSHYAQTISLNAGEQDLLIAFLQTLTDSSLTKNPLFSPDVDVPQVHIHN